MIPTGTITQLLRQLTDKGHKVTITAQAKEDESGEMGIQLMCNDAPNRFGINVRVNAIMCPEAMNLPYLECLASWAQVCD